MKTFFTFLITFFFHSVYSQVIFSESFDNSGFPPVGWKTERVSPSVSTTTDLWQRISVGHTPQVATSSGAGMAFFNCYKYSSGVKSDLTTPQLNFAGTGPYTVSFSVYRDAELLSMNDFVRVFVNTTQGSTGGVLIGTIQRSYQLSPSEVSSGWFRYTFNIPLSFSGQTGYITFNGSSAQGNNIYIDDIEVKGPESDNCKSPSDIRLQKLTTTTAEIGFTARQSDSMGYDWELRTTGQAGSGATGLISSGTTGWQERSVSVSGLLANTNYQFYIRNNCSFSNQSLWLPLYFTTACSIKNIPFFETFDIGTPPALPNCFTSENVNQNTGWTYSNLGSTGFTAPSYPNAVVYASATEAAGDDWLYTPALNLTAGVNYRLNFKYRALFSTFSNKLEIKYGMVPQYYAMSSAAVYSNSSIDNTNTAKAVTEFTVPVSGVYYIGFHNITPAGAFNYRMLLDDILLEYGPDSSCRLPQNITATEIGPTQAKITFDPPAGPYQSNFWELRTSGLPGSLGAHSNGTVLAGNGDVVFNSLAMGTNYKFYVMTNCASPSYSYWSEGISFTTTTTVCNPVNNVTISEITNSGCKASWSVPQLTSPHIGFDWELRTSGPAGSGATGLAQSGASTEPSVTITGLNASANYAFYVKSRCASGSSSGWVGSGVLTTAVLNDECINAIAVPVTNGFATNPVASRMDNANPTPGLSISCGIMNANNTNPLKDVWFKLTIPSTGNAIVETHTINENYRDQMMIAYVGDCGNLTEIECDRNGAPDDFMNNTGYQARIGFTGRTPGEVIYIRVLPDANPLTFNEFRTGEFGISAWDTTASVRPPVSTVGDCFNVGYLNITAANKNAFRWNPVFDSTGNIVAEIFPNGYTGQLNVNMFLNKSGNVRQLDSIYLLDRTITFTSYNQPSPPAYLRIYYTAEELQQLKTISPAADYNNLRIFSVNSGCTAALPATSNPVNTSGSGTYGRDFYIELMTSQLNQFHLFVVSNASAVNFKNFNAVNQPGKLELQWQTDMEFNIEKFIIEKSTDSLNFFVVDEVPALSSGNVVSSYAYPDASAMTGISYYRVLSLGIDGRVVMSKVVKAVFLPVRDLTAMPVGYPIQLDWRTEMEINNEEFVIERSIDNINFTSIGTLPTTAENGNSNSDIFYRYIDSTPLIGMNYYRIRQTDVDANINYSDVVQIQVEAPDYTVHLLEFYEVSSCSAVLSAIITVQGERADSIRFEYGINNFDQSQPAAIDSILSTTASVDTRITGLLPSSLYKFRTKFYFKNAWHYSDVTSFSTTDLTRPEIMLYDGSTVCDGGTLMLSSTLYYGNQWFLNGEEIDGAVYDQLEVSQAGLYSVIASDNGCVSPVSEQVEIKTGASPAIPQIQTPDGTNVCDGRMVNLYVEKHDGLTYQWMRNGVVIRGADQPQYLVPSGADYHVEVTNTSGCSASSSPLTISVITAPEAPVVSLQGQPLFCEGDSVNLNSTDQSYWYRNGIQVSTNTAMDLKVGASGSYYAVAVIGGCKSAASDTINITVKAAPVAVINSAGSTIFCEGGKLLLTATEASGNSYQWYAQGNDISNATSATYEVTASGKYKVNVTKNGCSSSSPEMEITVKPLPAQPLITVTGNILSSSATSGNYWLLNGRPIAGATSQQYTVKESGKYHVVVTKDGCTSKSAEFNFLSTGIVNPVTFNDLTIYPNPLAGQLIVSNEGRRKLHLRLTDAFGKTILERTINEQKTGIDTRSIPQGNYMLIITDLNKKETITRKLVKI